MPAQANPYGTAFGGAIIAWRDFRGQTVSYNDIYAQGREEYLGEHHPERPEGGEESTPWTDRCGVLDGLVTGAQLQQALRPSLAELGGTQATPADGGVDLAPAHGQVFEDDKYSTGLVHAS